MKLFNICQTTKYKKLNKMFRYTHCLKIRMSIIILYLENKAIKNILNYIFLYEKKGYINIIKIKKV